MASTINAATTSGGGVSTTADASGILELQTGGVTALTINATQNVSLIAGLVVPNGNVGIGTSSPANKLQVSGPKTTNSDQASIGQIFVSDSSIYSASPTAGIQFGLKYNAAGDLTRGCSIQGTKENATDGNFAQALVFTTQAMSSSPAERMRIDSSGNLLVGTTSVISNGKINSVFNEASQSGIGIKNTSATATGYFCAFYNSAGGLQGAITQTSSSVTAYNVSSDKRLKIDKGVATDTSVIDNIIVHDFEWKADGVSDRGVFAQEAYLVKPSAVTKGKDDLNKDGDIVHPWAVDYSKFVPDLIVYCQQLKKQVQEQQTLIEALTARLTTLEAK
jgi:hypothetical protein